MPPLADAPQNDEELPPPPTRAKKRAGFFSGKLFKAVCAFAAAVLLVLLGYGGFLIYGALVPGEVQQALTPANPESKPGDGSGGGPGTGRVEDERRIASISLEEIRQFMVENPAGRMMVIQGLAVNASESNKDYVAIEARLLDADNKTLDRAEQLCGAPLSLFQLQSLTVSELKEALNNRISIMTNNTNIPPGGKVPFVVVFPSPPRGTATFEVRVLDVRDSPPAQGG
ncbi:MAG: DUF3426 domain-containing protein [Desulfovibrio sp.]|jgi:hypothetical protein|nr:DUF3426 domain-containing protein [Desulfovibrio sp.]